ncbi:hypothetical protein U14_01366 [Candidatus Moduliflexus flocculans]|uniref:Histidine kinase/HSP90-like ATPase domain-containing protein n=1 Tax=Candidatus Moduliflexus flocculans TaxID=1499966 RepID=A0A0S6VRY9_9BACT|nr:hypothetical protein U14_01366 [Candidatus Moduliflexus flocculans]
MDICKQDHDFFKKDFEYMFQFYKIDAHFDQLWQMKSSARESLKDWLLASTVPPKIAETCANACSELIENCIKYTRENTRSGVAIHVDKTDITVETCNIATVEDCSNLRNSISALQVADDIKQLFVERLMQQTDGGGHLGLIKIALETKGRLELLKESADHAVHVRLCMEAK